MPHFHKAVDRNNRESMVAFLKGHYRYDTMGSWNGNTSYAHSCKLHNLGLSGLELNKAYDVLQTEYWHELEYVIADFTEAMGGNYTIGSNGRSSGYLVLYNSRWEETGHKSYCRSCGQRNFTACGVTEGDNKCGKCGAIGDKGRLNFMTPPRKLSVVGAGIDEEAEFEDWSLGQLQARVDVVEAFDIACDDIRDAFIAMLAMDVVEEVVMVPQKRMVLQAPTQQ